MSVDGFAQGIEGPVALVGIELGPGLVQAMVQDSETSVRLEGMGHVQSTGCQNP